jgi:hypothetical protein
MHASRRLADVAKYFSTLQPTHPGKQISYGIQHFPW